MSLQEYQKPCSEVNDAMHQAYKERLGEKVNMFRVVDARALRAERKNRAAGHLGLHRWNLASYLMQGSLRAWRIRGADGQCFAMECQLGILGNSTSLSSDAIFFIILMVSSDSPSPSMDPHFNRPQP